jgi:hypothetical protein
VIRGIAAKELIGGEQTFPLGDLLPKAFFALCYFIKCERHDSQA